MPVVAATRVALVIDEPHEQRRVAWPLTTGVPFPRGQLTDEQHCRLVDDTGAEQPLQSRVTATWDAERASVRWLTIDFIAHPGRQYALEFGDDVRRKSFPSPLVVEHQESTIVTTGEIAVDFDAESSSPLPSIRADFNSDGRIDTAEVALTGAARGGHYYLAQDGKRFNDASDGRDRAIVVEQSGPVRACIRVDGHYTGPDGQRVVAYRTRYHLFAGLGLIKVVDEFRIRKSTRGTKFHDIGLAWGLPDKRSTRRIVVDRSGESGNQVVEVPWTDATRAVSLSQSMYRHFGNPECVGEVVEQTESGAREVARSDRVGEWMQVVDDRAAITGSLRWFWQQFPKEWEATGDELVLHLWSPRGGQLDFGAEGLHDFFGDAGHKYILDWEGIPEKPNAISRFFYRAGHAALDRGDVDGQGINKHHEFYLHIGAADSVHVGQEYGQLAATPPLALAAGEWNCSTDVFGPLSPRPNDSPYEAIVDRIFDLGREAQDTFGDYGWWVFGSGPHYSYQWDKETKRHYADPRRFEYHTYQKETQLWWNYLRSGERKFHDWALPSENHWVDIAVTHVPLKYQCAWRGGFTQEQTLQLRPGDWSIDTALFYVRQRDSAEAWLRGGSQFWASYHRTLETTTLAYYLTGDERFNDVLQYWREYWSDLAGVTSESRDVPTWFREQPWFVPTQPGEESQTWAEMIRDYAPFTSGLRHQMTHFFNLATLYEHTWDPTVGQVLRECADAYLDPDHRIGVWRTQENGPPNYADAPRLCHYWVPALWKYERVTRDPRMPAILFGYFDAAFAADPFRGDVGQYSNVHLAYAYYYTRDPRHLRHAQSELERLLPNAAPLSRPQDLWQRLYNPYTPIRSFTAVPRLTWALETAARDGVPVPAEVLVEPQRTAIAIRKPSNRKVTATLWGFDRQCQLVGPDGKPFHESRVTTKQYSSDLQPFDRNARSFEVFLHEVTIPRDAPAGYYLLAPRLELAVLKVDGASPRDVLVNASVPVSIDVDARCRLSVSREQETLVIESATPSVLRVFGPNASRLPTTTDGNRLSVSLPQAVAGQVVEIQNAGRRKAWFRVANWPAEQSWLTLGDRPSGDFPSRTQTTAALPRSPATAASTAQFVAGRFGKALQVVPGRELRIPDHVTAEDGRTIKLFELRQGTIEFWVKRQWDERVTAVRPVTFLDNGLIQAWSPWKLPVDMWAHVAVEWRPLKRDPSRQAVHIYVNGHDQQNYRSTWWEGYSQKPKTFRVGKWLEAFVCSTQPDAPFVLDELRISSIPRYADLNSTLGGQQTFNPSRFDPPIKRFELDDHTLLMLHFDGHLRGHSSRTNVPIEAN